MTFLSFDFDMDHVVCHPDRQLLFLRLQIFWSIRVIGGDEFHPLSRRHLDAALELGRLCSNDPVCAQHKPSQLHEGRIMHGAACHGCLLIAEPSCERRNELLDRSLVVPTVDLADAAFFAEGS